MLFQLNFKSGKPVYLQLVDQVKAGGRLGRAPARRAAALDPAAGRRAARQPQHRRQGLCRAREPGRHRDRRRQGLLRPRQPVAVQQRRAPEAADRRDRRGRHSGASPAGRQGRLPAARRRTVRRVRTRSATRAANAGHHMTIPTLPSSRSTDLVRRYGRTDAVNGLNLRVAPGRCYGFFGRNGAGKTTTIKCLLNLLRPTSGSVRVFGLDPARHEVAVKSRLAYVPDHVAFYPWMTVRETLDYFASFRARWNREDGAGARSTVPARPAPEDEPPVEGPAHAARAHHRHLPRARAARARRADVGPRSDRPPRVHPDGHRRVSGRRSGTADGVRLDAPHLRVRGADRRVHDHRAAAAKC